LFPEKEEYWSCCEEYYFKLKLGHSRKSDSDLLQNENGDFMPDHSTGCKQHDYHESLENN